MKPIQINCEVNIYEISELLEKILKLWKKDSALRLDLAKVKEVDASFIQLILSCKRSAKAHSQELELIKVPEEVQLMLDGLYASDYINDVVTEGNGVSDTEQQLEGM